MMRQKRSKILTWCIGILILIEVAILAVVGVRMHSTRQYKEQLSLGDKYLQGMDYENAELCYLAAIEINGKNVTPYLNLAQIYMETGRFDEAYTILNEAAAIVSDEKFNLVEEQRIQVAEAEIRMQEAGESENEAGSELESEPEPEYQEPIFVQSSNIQEYKGNIYTSFEVYDNAGMIKIPGNYLVRLIVYDDHIYYIDAAGGTGNFGVELIRMNLDGSDPEVLVNNVDNWDSFCIYDNVLYYTSYESDFPSKSMDLNTMQIENEDYIFRYGSEEAWVVYKAGNYQKEYCCCPGYKEVREVPWEEGWIADEIPMDAYFGMYKEYMYFWGNNMILRDSIYSQENDAEVVLDSEVDWTCSPYVLGSGLYYFVSADEYLHRLDLDTMAEQTYDIANYMNKNEYLLLGVEEVNGKLYIDHYIDEYENGLSNANSEGLELDLKTGTIRSIGKWFES